MNATKKIVSFSITEQPIFLPHSWCYHITCLFSYLQDLWFINNILCHPPKVRFVQLQLLYAVAHLDASIVCIWGRFKITLFNVSLNIWTHINKTQQCDECKVETIHFWKRTKKRKCRETFWQFKKIHNDKRNCKTNKIS